MDRSYSSTILHTPSPRDRRAAPSPSLSLSLSSSHLLNKAQLAASIPPSASSSILGHSTTVQPLSFNPAAAPVRQTQSSFLPTSASAAKTVRFSPAHPSTTSASAFASQYSSAPPSRVQGFATPPRSYSSPSLLRTAQQNHGYASGGAATPPRQGQQEQQHGQSQGHQQVSRPSPSAQAKHFLHLGEQKVQSAIAKPGEVVREVKQKVEAVPIGRGEASRRLRVNAVLLVAWWVSSRTTMYRFAAGHLVAAAPQLDTPLHVCETLLLLLLCYNIIDALRALNALSSLPSSATVTALSSTPSRPGPARSPSSAFSLSSPARSSPKTRPSPSTFGSPSSLSASGSPTSARLRTASSPFRASALSSPQPPTPQTPTSALRGDAAASSALRRSLGGRASPVVAALGTPLSKGEGKDEVGGALVAFEARHSPGGGKASPVQGRKVVVESQEDIERLCD
ncbi:hypothetical protein JCM11641_002418 [Rhodosporidiobolus odoratus]